MRTFWWVSGQLTEVQRFINVPMRWCEQYPARERREMWVTTAEGDEFKLVVHGRVMPARRGHHVVGVLLDQQLVGLRNLTTGDRVNYVRNDPPLLWRRCDGLALVMVVVASMLAWAVGLPRAAALAGLPLTFLYPPAVVMARLLARYRLARKVDRAIESAQRQAMGQPELRRVK